MDDEWPVDRWLGGTEAVNLPWSLHLLGDYCCACGATEPPERMLVGIFSDWSVCICLDCAGQVRDALGRLAGASDGQGAGD